MVFDSELGITNLWVYRKIPNLERVLVKVRVDLESY